MKGNSGKQNVDSKSYTKKIGITFVKQYLRVKNLRKGHTYSVRMGT